MHNIDANCEQCKKTSFRESECFTDSIVSSIVHNVMTEYNFQLDISFNNFVHAKFKLIKYNINKKFGMQRRAVSSSSTEWHQSSIVRAFGLNFWIFGIRRWNDIQYSSRPKFPWNTSPFIDMPHTKIHKNHISRPKSIPGPHREHSCRRLAFDVFSAYSAILLCQLKCEIFFRSMNSLLIICLFILSAPQSWVYALHRPGFFVSHFFLSQKKCKQQRVRVCMCVSWRWLLRWRWINWNANHKNINSQRKQHFCTHLFDSDFVENGVMRPKPTGQKQNREWKNPSMTTSRISFEKNSRLNASHVISARE